MNERFLVHDGTMRLLSLSKHGKNYSQEKFNTALKYGQHFGKILLRRILASAIFRKMPLKFWRNFHQKGMREQ